jgi:uncharacterized protein
MIAAVGAAAVLVALLATGCSTYFGDDTSGVQSAINSTQSIGISVVGLGKVTVVPDIASIVLGVEAQALTVGEAQQQAAASMDAIMGVLDAHNIDEKDIQTQSYTIQPVRQYNPTDGKQTLVGYLVTNKVTVKVRNIDDAGSVIDDTVAAGGDNARVDSVGFTVDEPETYYTQMRQAAMADAKERAKQLAELTGVKVGKPISITESSYYNPPYITVEYYKDTAAGSSSETRLSPGEAELQLSVQVVFAIS